MALILTVPVRPGNSGLLTVSGLGQGVTEKGPLIAGFLVFLSHFPEIDPFDGNVHIWCQKGPDPGEKGPDPGRKCPNAVPARLWEPR